MGYLAVEDPDFMSNGVRKLKNPFIKRPPENRQDPRDIPIAAISGPVQQKDGNPRYREVGREDMNKIEEAEGRRKWRTDAGEYEARQMAGCDGGHKRMVKWQSVMGASEVRCDVSLICLGCQFSGVHLPTLDRMVYRHSVRRWDRMSGDRKVTRRWTGKLFTGNVAANHGKSVTVLVRDSSWDQRPKREERGGSTIRIRARSISTTGNQKREWGYVCCCRFDFPVSTATKEEEEEEEAKLCRVCLLTRAG